MQAYNSYWPTKKFTHTLDCSITSQCNFSVPESVQCRRKPLSPHLASMLDKWCYLTVISGISLLQKFKWGTQLLLYQQNAKTKNKKKILQSRKSGKAELRKHDTITMKLNYFTKTLSLFIPFSLAGMRKENLSKEWVCSAQSNRSRGKLRLPFRLILNTEIRKHNEKVH